MDRAIGLLSDRVVKLKRFEELACWQEAIKLVKPVYKAINKSEKFKRNFRLSGPASDTALATMSNIAEGFSRRSNKEFI